MKGNNKENGDNVWLERYKKRRQELSEMNKRYEKVN